MQPLHRAPLLDSSWKLSALVCANTMAWLCQLQLPAPTQKAVRAPVFYSDTTTCHQCNSSRVPVSSAGLFAICILPSALSAALC